MPMSYRQGEYAEKVRKHQSTSSWMREALRFIQAIPGGVTDKRVLDYGCGPGLMSYLLWLFRADVEGFDEDYMLFLANRSFHGPKFVRQVFGSYDVIVCSHVLGHVEHPEETLDDLVSLLRPGGLIAVLNPNSWNTRARALPNLFSGYRGDVTLKHHFSRRWLDRQMTAREFAVEKTYLCGHRWTRLPRFLSMPLFVSIYRDYRYDH
jgi:2-polyprenyl-3-methyl-5-hydroxy-6-metoxy-1,4-benzoquinol methylase